jgi:1-deoxy-D-xylulose-5-phosphate reductoisomerase
VTPATAVRQRVAILGATGSIGRQALDVIDRFPDRFEVFGLVAGRRDCDRGARFVIRADDPDFEARVEELVTHPDVDLVLVAIPGAAALGPTLAALEAGKKIALATKEVLVMAGDLVMSKAWSSPAPALAGHLPHEGGGREGGPWDVIRPVDSEHSALWQCLWGESPRSVSRLLLTATGGPFWSRPDLDLDQVSVDQALNHPRWSMGPKVTVDSASLMNKGLELIEARHLFGLALDRVEVVVHPQAVIHSIVEFVDGSAKAQLSNPDMRLPIGLALSYPERLPGVVPRTIFADLGSLELQPLDDRRFPAVGLARQAAGRGAGYPAVLNAANEEGVAAFLAGRISFGSIVRAVEEALEAWPGGATSLAEILDADRFARAHVRAWIGKVRA